jgi:hypothetical protein
MSNPEQLEPADRLLTVLLDGIDTILEMADAEENVEIEETMRAWVDRSNHVVEDIYQPAYVAAARASR